MQKYFIGYKYKIGYENGTGNTLYEDSSCIMEIDFSTVNDIYDLQQIVLESELTFMKELDKYDVLISICNKV